MLIVRKGHVTLSNLGVKGPSRRTRTADRDWISSISTWNQATKSLVLSKRVTYTSTVIQKISQLLMGISSPNLNHLQITSV